MYICLDALGDPGFSVDSTKFNMDAEWFMFEDGNVPAFWLLLHAVNSLTELKPYCGKAVQPHMCLGMSWTLAAADGLGLLWVCVSRASCQLLLLTVLGLVS